jgi:hypothetical protein
MTEALFQVQCKTCNAFVLVGAGADFHAALKCDCCPQGREHDHKASAMACPGSSDLPGPVGHDGAPCAPGADGCTVCRPLIITPLPGTVTVTGA